MRKRLRDTWPVGYAHLWVSASLFAATVGLLVASGTPAPLNDNPTLADGAPGPQVIQNSGASQNHAAKAVEAKASPASARKPAPGNIPLHVAQDRTPVYSAPSDEGGRIATLSMYTDVLGIESSPDARWIKVILEDGREGYVSSVFVAGGMGLDAYTYQCRAAGVTRPNHGEVLVGQLDGAHDLRIPGTNHRDAVLSLEDPGAGKAISVYIRGGESLTIVGIPDGSFSVDYLQGLDYSPVCAVFTTDPQLKHVSQRLKLDGPPGVVSLSLRQDTP